MEPGPAGAPAPSAPPPAERPTPVEPPGRRAPAPSSKRQPASSGPPSWAEIGAQLKTGPAKAALAYLGIYTLAEVLAAVLDTRLGLLVHAGLLLAIIFHGTNVPAGPERTFFWTLWLAPLTRIYGLAQPYAGAPPLTWWALTAIPMVVAGLVAMRLAGMRAREAGLVPSMREAPIAVFMVPVGLALGIVEYLLLEPRALAQELGFGGAALVAAVVIVNPGIVDEIVFRGVLQRGTAGLFGPGPGVLYVSLVYALAPPLSPPQAGAPGVGPQPGAPGAPAVQGQAAVVRGTGGSGARLRAQPGNSGPIITVVPENTPLLVIGADRTVDGLVWRNVRAPNGNEGWIAANFVTTGQ